MKLVRERKEKKVLGLKKVWDIVKNNKVKIYAATGVVIICSVILFSIITKPTESEKLSSSISIVQEYSEEDVMDIKNYLEISEKLNDFMKKHKILSLSEEEISEKMGKTSLQSVESLNKELEDLNTMLEESNFSKEDVYKRIEKLMIQEILVNKYLYDSYPKVNSIIEEALKAYAGEKYGVIDTENLGFYYKFSYPEQTVYYVYYGDFENRITSGIDSSMRDAMILREQTTSSNDSNPNDNDKYNPDRNKLLKQGLIVSGKLYEQVKNKDLYSSKLAKKIRK